MQTDCFMYWEKDLNSAFLTTNQYCAKLLGFDLPEKLMGRTDYELHCPVSDLAGAFQKHDKEVIRKNKTIKFFEIMQFVAGSAKISITTKSPLVDGNNNIIGTRGFSMDITQLFMQFNSLFEYRHQIFNSHLLQNSYAIKFIEPSFLTKVESECLFLLLYKKTHAYIANFLRLSLKTVEKTIVQLKTKFSTNTTAELVDLAIDQGFLYVIPSRFLSQQMSMILD